MAIKACLMFAGQGAQFPGMGKDLVESSAAAKEIFTQADEILGRSISDLCFSGTAEELTASANCQPAIYTMSVACMAALKEKLDIDVQAVSGLSLGEFAALHAAGVLTFADGLKLVAARGKLMDEACQSTDGTMAAVLNADPELIKTTCADCGIDAANFNCPGQIVISGSKDGVEKCIAALKEAGVSRVIPLQVAGAFHSRCMQSAADQIGSILSDITFSEPVIPVMQNVTGAAPADLDELIENIKKQVTGSVLWENCVGELLAKEPECLIELGPGKVLSGFMRKINRKFPTYNVSGADDLAKVAETLS